MSKEKEKEGIIFNIELDGMDKIQDQLKDLNGQLDGIINKFEKIAELSKLKMNNVKKMEVDSVTLTITDVNGRIIGHIDEFGNCTFYKGIRGI